MSDGQTIIGGYELKNCVATGSVSQIWEVSDQGGTGQFAMKLLLPEAHADPENKSMLKHEFKVGKAMEHPNFVRFHQIEVNRDHAFFLMDYFRAPSLKNQIGTGLPNVQSRFKKVAEAVTQALAHMHEKGWLHRDIKPDNILVNKTGECRVIDFSLSSRATSGLGKLLAGKQKDIKGTRTYIAPETLRKKAPTIQTDIYSLGITFFEVLAGHPPFRGTSPSELLRKHIGETPHPPSLSNPNVTPEADQLVLKMLAKKPADRQADMRELHTACRTIKFFKEDPSELYERQRKEEKERQAQTVDKRLDSRADAERREKGIPTPQARPKKKPPVVPIREAEAKPAPVPPQMPPHAQPPYGMPMPQYPQWQQGGMPPQYPQWQQPGMMPPPMTYPPGMYPPQMMPPGQHFPQHPMLQQPQPAMPQQPMPQHAPPAPLPPDSQQPVAAQPVQPDVPSAEPEPVKPPGIAPGQILNNAQHATAKERADLDNLEVMTELPDFE